MVFLRRAALLAAVIPMITLAACGGDKLNNGGDNNTGGGKGNLVLSGQNYTEMLVMGEMYKAVLEKAGYTVTFKKVATRNLYMPQLESGNVDIVPEYLSSATDYLTQQAHGADAPSVATSDVGATLAKFKALGAKKGLDALEPSNATDQNAFFVTKKFADSKSLKSLSDLAALNQPIRLAAASDCPDRGDCAKGLKSTYGLDIKQVLPLGFGTTQTKDSVLKGESLLGQSGTTDGTLDTLGLVLLADDKSLQHAENLIPLINADFLKAHPDVAPILNKLSSTLTTADLAKLNFDVDSNRQEPSVVAQDYLKSKGLL